jgi:hypothetical protein
LFWCTKKIENVLEKCARSREEFQNKEKRRRWSKFTGNFAGVHRHLRIGELECGILAAVLLGFWEGEVCGREGSL